MEMDFAGHRRIMGESTWLWLMLVYYSEQSNAEWWPVSSAAMISDEQLGSNLEVTAATAKKWRKRLEAAGMIRTERVQPGKWKIWVLNANQPGQQSFQMPLCPSALVH
jgi:hypothetical protein